MSTAEVWTMIGLFVVGAALHWSGFIIGYFFAMRRASRMIDDTLSPTAVQRAMDEAHREDD
jgi:uncharacterized protein YneF (UPF0154 family)